MKRRYHILDVFTDRPLAGNPLAVVTEAEGLDTAAMQAIAQEFNLSETVFVGPAANPRHTASLRIFTPTAELPFAGHPTVGTAVLLGMLQAERNGAGPEAILMLEEKVGLVRAAAKVAGRGGHGRFDAPRQSARAGEARDKTVICAALGLLSGEIGFENHVPSVFSAGVPFVYVPVRDLATIAKARADTAHWDAAFGETTLGAFLYCRETVGAGHHFHARMFAPGAGIVEDPATGAAVVGLGGVILHFDQPVAGSHRSMIEQGFEMGRPSLIGLEIDVDGGALVATRIAGDAVVVAEGFLDI